MARKIPPRRVPRDRRTQRGGSPGGIFSGASVPGAHTHLEIDITDLDKYSVAAADAAFAPISHTHLEAEITDLQAYLLSITGEPLSDLSDVTITAIAAGELLKWSGSAWINQTLAESGIAATSHTHVEANITDLQAYLVSPLTTDGDVLYYNAGHQRLAKGSDTQVLTLAAGLPTWATPGTGVTDHGALTGLGDDDHSQYLILSAGAARPLTGAFYMELGSPSVNWKESDATADNKHWQAGAFGERLLFRVVSDDLLTTDIIFAVDRTAAAVDSITFGASLLTDGLEAHDIGDATNRWGDIYAGQFQAYAENAFRYNGAHDAGTAILNMGQGYIFYSDSSGAGTANTRLWLDALDQTELIIGGRSGGNYFDGIRIKARRVTFESDGATGGAGVAEVEFDLDVNPLIDSTYDLGTTTLFWKTLYADRVVEDLATATKGAGTTYTPDAVRRIHRIATTGATVTIANPTNLLLGQTLMIIIKPGATGVTVTWGSQYRIAGPTTVIANFHGSHPFVWDGADLMLDGAWSSTA